jgi:hypothetical protein
MGQVQERQESGSGATGRDATAAAIEWLAAAFPDVACSLAPSPMAFAPSAAFWAEASADVDACLAYQDRFASGMDDKIRAAHLIAFYSHQFSLAAGAIYLSGGVVPKVSGLRFESYPRSVAGGTLEAGRFHFLVEAPQSVGEVAGEARDRRFHDFFIAHLKRVIALVKRHCGLSSRAQWRLAADGLAGAFLEIGRRQGQEEAAIERALAIVKRGGSPLFSPELHYEEIDAVVEGGEALSRTYRIRGGCCLYYRTDGGGFCDTCVLLDPGLRRERLRAHLIEVARKQPAEGGMGLPA